MTIATRVLGIPGQDNAVFMRIDTGQSIYNLQFDCGEGCLYHLGRAVLQDMNHLFISHGHMDHICGFDGLFRNIYSSPKPFHIWGPSGIIDLMHCRFRGFTWNLVGKSPGEMIVHEISEKQITSARFLCREAFAKLYPLAPRPFHTRLIDEKDYIVDCALVSHGIDCISYAVLEPEKININTDALKSLGLEPGKWCALLKRTDLPADYPVDTGDKKIPLSELQATLLEKRKGSKAAYVTDLIMNEANRKKIYTLIEDSDEVIMESSYDDTEMDLANQNYHLTVSQAATAAKETNAKKLILFHISDRYSRDQMSGMLKKGRRIFPETYFPGHWII